MFSRLLVGLDGSAGADAALGAAIELGRRFRSTVVLAAVADIGAPLLASGAAMADAPLNFPDLSDLSDTLATRATNLTAAAQRRVQAAGLDSETVHFSGLVDDELLRLADEADAIVVGRRGELHDAPGTIGAVTARIIKRAPKPVVVAGEQPSRFQHPVVAYDGGTTSSNALSLAARYAEAAGVSLDVVHVGNDPVAANELLALAGAQLSNTRVGFTTHHLTGRLVEAIEAHLAATGADLLVAGAHGGRKRSRSSGSNAAKLIRATTVPVIVIR